MLRVKLQLFANITAWNCIFKMAALRSLPPRVQMAPVLEQWNFMSLFIQRQCCTDNMGACARICLCVVIVLVQFVYLYIYRYVCYTKYTMLRLASTKLQVQKHGDNNHCKLNHCDQGTLYQGTMVSYIKSSLVQVMVFCLFVTKPLTAPILTY